MKSYVGAVILLATVANSMAQDSVGCARNLTQVVENCYHKNHATCDDINSYLNALASGVVGKDSPAICFLACIDIDGGMMVPGKSFILEKFNAWYPKESWSEIDPLITKCTSGANMHIKNVCDREYDLIKCLLKNKSRKVLAPSPPFVPAACRK